MLKLVCKKHLELMLQDYIEYYPERVDRIGNSSLKKLAKALSSQDQKAKQAVEYASGVLLYDNFDLIQRVLQTSENADELMKLANSLEAFVKSSFEKHIATCDTTRTKFLLEGADSSSVACDICTLLHRAMEYFKANVHPDCHHLLEDYKTKILLYQGHCVRVVSQQKYIRSR